MPVLIRYKYSTVKLCCDSLLKHRILILFGISNIKDEPCDEWLACPDRSVELRIFMMVPFCASKTTDTECLELKT